MNLIGFQEFSAQAPLLQLFNFFQIWTFFNVMTLILYQFFLWNWEICGWLREINKLFYKKQSFLFSNDHIIFMTKYGCLSYEYDLTKVFSPLFKSFLPPFCPKFKIDRCQIFENMIWQKTPFLVEICYSYWICGLVGKNIVEGGKKLLESG